MAGALIGALRVSLSAETTAFEVGMGRAQNTAKKTAANINKAFKDNLNIGKIVERSVVGFVTALTIGGFIRATKAALDYAGSLGELASTLGLTTKDLQTFSYAAGQVGVSQDELQTGIQKLTISIGQAEVGAQKQIKAFQAIGIAADSLKGKNAGEVFKEIADKLSTVSDRSQRAAVEVALFGKAGAKLDNLLSGAQGNLGALSDHLEKLGLVLSDEQIQNADRTADKIDELHTALKTRIAGIVADNASSIYDLINALEALLSKLPVVIRSYQAFLATLARGSGYLAQISRNPADRSEGRLQVAVAESQMRDLANQQRGGKSFDERAQRLRNALGLGNPPPGGGGDIGDFLAPKGSKPKKDHSAEELQRKQLDALQKAYDYQRDELDAQKNILEAKKDLSDDFVEQTTLSVQILDLERQQYKAELDNQVAQNKITKGKEGIDAAQAEHLLSLYDQADHDKRTKLVNDEQEQAQRDSGELDDRVLERKKDYLEKLVNLATTQSERRKIQLDILELEYQEKKQVLDRIVANSKNAKEVEDARRDLLALEKNHAADKQGVINSTRNPLEEWAAGAPKSAKEITEALQSIEANGIQGLSEALTGVITGTESLKSAFHNLAASILADLIQMTIKMVLFKALASAFGSFGGFTAGGVPVSGARASGGPVMGRQAYLVGERGPEIFMPKMSGSIIPNSKMSVGNDNMRGPTINIPISIDATGADPAGLARVAASLDQLRAELPSKVVEYYTDARQRFVIRK